MVRFFSSSVSSHHLLSGLWSRAGSGSVYDVRVGFRFLFGYFSSRFQFRLLKKPRLSVSVSHLYSIYIYIYIHTLGHYFFGLVFLWRAANRRGLVLGGVSS